LTYKPYFFSQRTIFFLITNQPTVFSAMAYQPSEQGSLVGYFPGCPATASCLVGYFPG